MRVKIILITAVVFALAIVSTTFSLLALTSKEWSGQALYDAGYGNQSAFIDNNNVTIRPDGTMEITPVCVVPRSPFYRCNLPKVYFNDTCLLDCEWYAPYGWNKTSCRSAAEFGQGYNNKDYEVLLGHGQECQEVHYAGNLQIAASAFTVLALCAGLVLCTATINLGFLETKRGTSATGVSTEDGEEIEAVQHNVESKAGRQHYRRHAGASEDVPRHAGSAVTPWIVAFFLACLCIGAVLQLLAQFFGVLGLTVNATPSRETELLLVPDSNNPADADDGGNFDPDSWKIGKALSTYATIAWASAIACACLATIVMRRPRVAKIL